MQIASAVAFWLLAATALLLGWAYNKGVERILVAAIALAIIGTAAAGLLLGPRTAFGTIVLLDTALAAVAVAVALRASTHWPLWFAGLASVGAITAIANWISDSHYWLFRMFTGFWSIPALTVLLIGSVLDERRRKSIRSARS
jgi:hypothetical protein